MGRQPILSMLIDNPGNFSPVMISNESINHSIGELVLVYCDLLILSDAVHGLRTVSKNGVSIRILSTMLWSVCFSVRLNVLKHLQRTKITKIRNFSRLSHY